MLLLVWTLGLGVFFHNKHLTKTFVNHAFTLCFQLAESHFLDVYVALNVWHKIDILPKHAWIIRLQYPIGNIFPSLKPLGWLVVSWCLVSLFLWNIYIFVLRLQWAKKLGWLFLAVGGHMGEFASIDDPWEIMATHRGTIGVFTCFYPYLGPIYPPLYIVVPGMLGATIILNHFGGSIWGG